MKRAERNAEIINRARQGDLYGEIARDVDLTSSHVAYLARRAGIVRSRSASGAKHPRWKGGRAESGGYRFVRKPEHPRANPNGYVREHILVVENILGRFLPENAVVHHVNGNGLDNRPSNLVVCEDDPYHHLLHRREFALDESGHADWVRCPYCGEWDAPSQMYILPGKRSGYHRACERRYQRRRRQER